MDDYSENGFGFHTRATALLNNKTFSDVEIQVRDGSSYKTFPAHKLFLAMSSKYFADKLYGPNTNSVKSFQIFDYQPKTVYAMLQYLYTDEINFDAPDEVKNIYRLAKKYSVIDLERKCLEYFTQGDTNLQNIFEKYDFALSENIAHGVEICRNLVARQTMAVLKAPFFTEASLRVIEDILQLDSLAVESELDVIKAAIEWAKHECMRRGDTTESLRICLYPLFQYLRFLSLSGPEFLDFVEQNSNILNAHESSKLMMAILQPSSNSGLPSGFSANALPRNVPIDNEDSPNMPVKDFTLPMVSERIQKDRFIFEKNLTFQEGTSSINDTSSLITLEDSWSSNNLNGTFVKSSEKTQKLDMQFGNDLVETLKKNFHANSKPLGQNLKIETKKNYVPLKENFSASKSMEYNKNQSFESSGANSKGPEPLLPINYKNPLKAFDADIKNSVAKVNTFENPYPRMKSKPTYFGSMLSESMTMNIKRQSPMMKVSPHINMNHQQAFEFPLQDLEKEVSSTFAKDIKCSADIQLSRGAIEIFGIELKIKQCLNPEESIEAFLTLSGSNFNGTITAVYEEKLKNSIYPIRFKEPVKLLQNNRLKIEVTVEELILNRCSGYNLETCELNCGLNVMADITMKSNQYSSNTNRDFFYIISRLLYRPHA